MGQGGSRGLSWLGLAAFHHTPGRPMVINTSLSFLPVPTLALDDYPLLKDEKPRPNDLSAQTSYLQSRNLEV